MEREDTANAAAQIPCRHVPHQYGTLAASLLLAIVIAIIAFGLTWLYCIVESPERGLKFGWILAGLAAFLVGGVTYVISLLLAPWPTLPKW